MRLIRALCKRATGTLARFHTRDHLFLAAGYLPLYPARMEYYTVYTTTDSEMRASEMAFQIIEEKLAACANILPYMSSIYHYNGKVNAEQEVAILFKVNSDGIKALMQRIQELHTYETPCIIAWQIMAGHMPYFQWIDGELKKDD